MQVSEQLCRVHGLEALDGLELENHEILDDEVRVEIPDALALEEHRHRHLHVYLDRSALELAERARRSLAISIADRDGS